jgi:cell wall-associated NlpC family hydrolase
MQERALGALVEHQARSFELQRGDLIFWKGHVAIARDRETLVHANAFHMAVVIEPAGEAMSRIRGEDGETGGEITSVRRLRITAA